jgi:antitoxin HigA-1
MSRLSTTTRRLRAAGRGVVLAPVHPGEILREDLMVPLGLSINRLARELHVPVNRVSEIVGGRRGITADTALRLARYFRNSAEFWLNLQSTYDLQSATRERAKAIAREVRPRSAA